MEYYEFENLAIRFAEVGEAVRRAGEAFKSLIELYDDECTNKRIVHLAKHHKKTRVRKKNRRRILRGKW